MTKKLLLHCLVWGVFLMISAAQAEIVKDFKFRVSVDNTEIGTHTFILRERGQELTVESKASFEFKILFVTLFDYQHTSREIWKNGCLRQMKAETNNNGEMLSVHAEVIDNRFAVKTNTEKAELSGCVRSFAYWDKALVQTDRLLNPQTGEYLKVLHSNLGSENIELDGKPVPVTRILISTREGPVNLWYDNQGAWLALESERSDGKVIRYQRVMHENS